MAAPTDPRAPAAAPRRPGGVAAAAQVALSALVVALIAVIYQVSLASVIYQGPLAAFVDRGIALALIGSVVMATLSGVVFSFRGTMASPQNSFAVIVSLGAAIVVGGMADPASEQAFATVAALVAVTSLVTGAIAWPLGRFGLGAAARFIPYPVLTGFMAATGYILVAGGLGVALGQPVGVRNLAVLIEPGNPVRWLPWTLAAIALAVLLGRFHRPAILPLGLIVAGAAFYLVAGALGLGEAEREAFLLGPFDTGFLAALRDAEPLAVDGRALMAGLPHVLAAAGMCIISSVMSASSIEVGTGIPVDPDRDLRGVGLVNLAGGLVGGPAGHQSLSLTLLAHEFGISGRLGWLAAGCYLVALTVGARAIGAIPAGVVAAAIIVMGLGMMVRPLVEQRRRLPAADYAVVVVITAVTAAFGILWGVAVGLLVAALSFVVAFSRIDVVRLATSGARLRSPLERPPADQARLAELGRHVAVYRLEGYLFFGTAHQLVQRVAAALERAPRPRHVVVDFRRVRGIDTSAARALTRLVSVCGDRDVALHLAGLDGAAAQIVRAQLSPDAPRPDFAPHIEQVLEEVETALLRQDAASSAAAPGFLDELRRLHPAADLDSYTRAVSVPAGFELIAQGGVSDSLIVLASGLLRTEVAGPLGGSTTVARCLPGALVGEVGLYAGTRRTARVVAEEPSEILHIDAAQLERMARDDLALLADLHRLIASTLARRLSRTTALLADSGATA